MPGAAEDPAIDELAAAGRALDENAQIDRDAVYRLKLDGLARLWRRFPGSPDFDAFRTRHGDDLAGYATFCALAEHHRSGWSSWPAEHQRPDAPAVARFAAEHADRVRFHAWLQWLLDGQLDRAGATDLMIADVAVGFAPDGADAWAWQDTLALDMRIGAPPDQFNTRARAGACRRSSHGDCDRPATSRSSARSGPPCAGPRVSASTTSWACSASSGSRWRRAREGTYVRFDGRELLDIVALESARAAAFVVGEDLGTVEGDVRSRLAAAGMLSYRLLWFEPGDPEEYPRQALAAVSTHDLPTVAGLWSGADLAAQRALGLEPNEQGTVGIREHLASLTGATDDTPVDEVVVRAYRRLADAPSMVVTASLDDALAVPDRPNMPGTVDQWPNWSIPLPLPIDDLAGHALAGRVLDAVARRGPVRSPPP